MDVKKLIQSKIVREGLHEQNRISAFINLFIGQSVVS